MNPQHPRTQHGPRIPEEDCTGTARQLFGMTEAEVAAEADAISESPDDFHGDSPDVLE